MKKPLLIAILIISVNTEAGSFRSVLQGVSPECHDAATATRSAYIKAFSGPSSFSQRQRREEALEIFYILNTVALVACKDTLSAYRQFLARTPLGM